MFPSPRFWLTAASWWKRGNLSYIFFMSLLSLWEFSSARDKFTAGKKKVSSTSELIFPSNILEEKCCGRTCAGGEVITLGLWGCVRHSQTTLMPHAVICQSEPWSRILLITFCWEKRVTAVSCSCLFSPISHSPFISWWNWCGRL